MKYIKEYNEYIDPFNEDDWNEVEPDGSFLAWLKSKYPDENTWKDLTMIGCSNQNLTDLIGIDKLINLIYLSCRYNQLTELDVSENINLEHLYCENNQLTKLDVTKNIKLKYLCCEYNQLTELDVTKNVNLIDLYCKNNQLKELDIRRILI